MEQPAALRNAPALPEGAGRPTFAAQKVDGEGAWCEPPGEEQARAGSFEEKAGEAGQVA